ncbi:MAG TPA: transcriptional regulator [Chloroflexi bacterium]|nr:transcriptional regulator [Chloroflexota bacterium]
MAEANLKVVSEPIAKAQDDVCEILYVDEPRVKAVAAQMPADETIRQVANIFKVLSDPTRVRIIFALSRAELCVCDLAALLGLSISAVSHQLRLLRNLRLVKYRKEGRLAYYSLDDDHTGQLLHEVLEHVQ